MSEEVEAVEVQPQQPTQPKRVSTAAERLAAKKRQRVCRERKVEREQVEAADTHQQQVFDDLRRRLGVVSMLEISPDVFVTTFNELLTLTREFARRLAVPIEEGDTLKAFFARTFTRWIDRRSPGLDRTHDQFVWTCCFGYSKRLIAPIVEIVSTLDGVNDPIQTDPLDPFPFRCSEPRPAPVANPKLAAHHAALDADRQAELEIEKGDFEVVDTGTHFEIVTKSAKSRGELGYSFSRAWPGDLWPNWKALALADAYLRSHTDDERFGQSVRDRITRVLAFRKLQRTKFEEAENGLHK